MRPDHGHARISIGALRAGEDVYCEKPVVQQVAQCKNVAAAQESSGRAVQVGSQYVSSLVCRKARELLKAGAIALRTS